VSWRGTTTSGASAENASSGRSAATQKRRDVVDSIFVVLTSRRRARRSRLLAVAPMLLRCLAIGEESVARFAEVAPVLHHRAKLDRQLAWRAYRRRARRARLLSIGYARLYASIVHERIGAAARQHLRGLVDARLAARTAVKARSLRMRRVDKLFLVGHASCERLAK
jgi:hypothetical protein